MANFFSSVLRWMDGSPVVFQRWEENQPDFRNNDENCAIMTHHIGKVNSEHTPHLHGHSARI